MNDEKVGQKALLSPGSTASAFTYQNSDLTMTILTTQVAGSLVVGGVVDDASLSSERRQIKKRSSSERYQTCITKKTHMLSLLHS